MLLMVPPPQKKTTADGWCQGAAEPAKQRVKRRVFQMLGQTQMIILLLNVAYIIYCILLLYHIHSYPHSITIFAMNKSH